MSKVLHKTRQWQAYSGQIRAEYYSRGLHSDQVGDPAPAGAASSGHSPSRLWQDIEQGARVQCLAQYIGHSDTLPPEMQPGCPFDGATREAATYSSALPPPKLTYVCRLQFVPF